MIPEHDQVIIRQDSDPNQASLWILILSAAAIPHTVRSENSLFYLIVDCKDQLKAEHELYSYHEENRDWPPKQKAPDTFTPLFAPFSVLVIGLLALFYLFTGPWNQHSDWFIHGAGDSTLILQQYELYRLITALTLHADAVHLTGNCIIGVILFHFLCKTCGNGFALFSMLLTATIGNLINVMIHGNNHHFVGFSTAVFAIVGIMTSIQMVNFKQQTRDYLRIVTPLMAGFGLLAIFGSSGERTDLGAHFFGLICGSLGGATFYRTIYRYRTSVKLQIGSFILSAALILGAWMVAFLSK